jgi:hypothetical protein
MPHVQLVFPRASAIPSTLLANLWSAIQVRSNTNVLTYIERFSSRFTQIIAVFVRKFNMGNKCPRSTQEIRRRYTF